MRVFTFALVSIFAISFSFSALAAVPQLLKKMQEKYRASKTITFEFLQKQKNAATAMTTESSGRIFLAPPEKFRWQTESPQPQLVVSNGKKIWIYTAPFREGEAGQVVVKRPQDFPAKMALDLISGRGELEKSFEIKDLKEGRFHLKPKKPVGDVTGIELFLEKPTNLVYKIALSTQSGNETELELKNVKFNAKLGDRVFIFEAPKGTQEIH